MAKTATTSTGTKFQVYLDGDKFWELLENGKDTDDLYPDHFKTEIIDVQYSKYMESIIMPGEKYALLEGNGYDYAVTSLGRVVNCLYDTQVAVYITTIDAKIVVREEKLKMSKVFMDNGWDFNMDTIKKNYAKYKWKLRNS
jgi:nitrogen fixation protein